MNNAETGEARQVARALVYGCILERDRAIASYTAMPAPQRALVAEELAKAATWKAYNRRRAVPS
jgi:hypothetical protein